MAWVSSQNPSAPRIFPVYRGFYLLPSALDGVDPTTVAAVNYYEYKSSDNFSWGSPTVIQGDFTKSFAGKHLELSENIFYKYTYTYTFTDDTISPESEEILAGAAQLGLSSSLNLDTLGSDLAPTVGTVRGGYLVDTDYRTNSANPTAGFAFSSTLSPPVTLTQISLAAPTSSSTLPLGVTTYQPDAFQVLSSFTPFATPSVPAPYFYPVYALPPTISEMNSFYLSPTIFQPGDYPTTLNRNLAYLDMVSPYTTTTPVSASLSGTTTLLGPTVPANRTIVASAGVSLSVNGFGPPSDMLLVGLSLHTQTYTPGAYLRYEDAAGTLNCIASGNSTRDSWFPSSSTFLNTVQLRPTTVWQNTTGADVAVRFELHYYTTSWDYTLYALKGSASTGNYITYSVF